MPSPLPSGASPIESIRLATRFERDASLGPFQATSRPGHLIHLVVAGQVEQSCNGRRQLLLPGSVVWYHEDEWVEGRVLRSPWIYYSVNFSAPTLPPPGFDARLFPNRADLEPIMRALCDRWCRPPSTIRDYACQARLLDLLASLQPENLPVPLAPAKGNFWWKVETWARQHIGQAPTLDDLCARFHRSPNTLARACHEAVGLPPMRRLKQIRLNLARGLVHFSDLTITEIALRVGYVRVHEFSRDYSKAHGRAPSKDRASTRQ